MGERRRRIDKVLDATFLTNLSEWPLDELRSRHAECLEIETEVSYVRRMTQARRTRTSRPVPVGAPLPPSTRTRRL